MTDGDRGQVSTTVFLAVFFLVTLLVAGGAAVGVGMALENRPETWRSTAVVRLVPGSVPSGRSLQADVTRYVSSASTSAFTETVAEGAGIPKSALREDVSVQQRAPGQLGITVLAATSREARLLAASAGRAVARMVRTDQTEREPRADARVGALVVVASTEAIKTEPRAQDALLAGALTGGVVLALATWFAAVRVNRRLDRR